MKTKTKKKKSSQISNMFEENVCVLAIKLT